MAETSKLYNKFLMSLAQGGMIWADTGSGGDTLKIALLNSSYTFDATHESIDDVAVSNYEISGGNYARVTMSLIDVTVDETNKIAKLDADNSTFTNITNTFRSFVIYNDSLVSNGLVLYCDLGESKTITGANFEIIWDALGVIEIHSAI